MSSSVGGSPKSALCVSSPFSREATMTLTSLPIALMLKNVFYDFMKKNGYNNIEAVLRKWREKELIKTEADRLTNRKTIEGKKFIVITIINKVDYIKHINLSERNTNTRKYLPKDTKEYE